MSVNVIVKNKYKKMANANVKSFDEYMSSRNEEVVHGTPGEDTSKWKGDESGKDLFEINEDSCCSTDCQKMVKEMYETMCIIVCIYRWGGDIGYRILLPPNMFGAES